MTRKEALAELIAKVEAGEAWPMGRFADRYDVGIMGAHWSKAYKACHGSLDAAKSLHEAVLPGWSWRITRGKYTPCAIVQGDLMAGQHSECENPDPARAWLLAILKALETQEAD